MSSYRTGMGYLINGTNSTRPFEADVLTCAHCQGVLLLHVWREDGAFCRREMKPLCGKCGDRALFHGCEPFMKTLEDFTREQKRLSGMVQHAQLIVPK